MLDWLSPGKHSCKHRAIGARIYQKLANDSLTATDFEIGWNMLVQCLGALVIQESENPYWRTLV